MAEAHAKVPCENCPYRVDAPRKLWSRIEFEGVLASELDGLGKVYACHKQAKLPEKERGFCAGWLLDQKRRRVPSISLRMRIATSDDAARAIEEVSDGGHEMFPTVAAMCRANGVHPRGYGRTGAHATSGRCSNCGGSNFNYARMEFSAKGVRGYRCLGCRTIKPEDLGR